MSVAGQNAIHGSTLSVYRPTTAPGTGGQTTTTWVPVLLNIKLALYQLTDERVRQIFGVDTQVALVAFAEVNVNIRGLDAIHVTVGPYAGTRYRVDRTRRSRKYLEIGLKETREVFP